MYIVNFFNGLSNFVFFRLPPYRKKSKPPPSVIQISSKSRLSSWSKPTLRPKSKSVTERTLDDLSFASMHRSKLSGLPTSFSDPCLAKRRLEDSDEFKISSSSAPESCSGSSGSDDEDDDSGETDDMEHYDPSVNNTAQGSGVGEKVANGTPENKADIVPEGETKSDEPENENVELPPTQGVFQSEDSSDDGERSKECGFVVGDEPGSGEQSDQDSKGSQDRGTSVSEEGAVAGKTSSEEPDRKLERKKSSESNDRNNEELSFNQDHESQADKQGEVTSDHLTHDKAQNNKLSEERGDSSEHSAVVHKAKSLPKRGNGEINSNEHTASFQANNEGLQISFHGTTASMKVSHSSVELGTMASSGSINNGDRSPERRRFGARFPGNRGLKIFATAQARGRTLIPELRSKLSSFSQQVRSRSSPLSPKRPSLHNESNHEQKQLRRKCRTKIIEL